MDEMEPPSLSTSTLISEESSRSEPPDSAAKAWESNEVSWALSEEQSGARDKAQFKPKLGLPTDVDADDRWRQMRRQMVRFSETNSIRELSPNGSESQD